MREQLTTARRLWPLTAVALLSVVAFLGGLVAGPN
jgi:hypothetical protein